MATAIARNKRTGDTVVGSDMEKRTERGKRRRGYEPEHKQSQAEAEEEEEEKEEVTEGEVEAFFAILRRIKESAPGDDMRGRRAPEERNIPAWMWRPTFEFEDFEGAKAGSSDDGRRRRRERATGKVEEEEETAAGDELPRHFDLNVEPANERNVA